VTTAPKPTGPLAANASCITPACHAEFATAAHIHGPIAGGDCLTCHAPDQGGHTYPLIRTGNATCTFCHAVAGTKAHQHKAVEMPPGSITLTLAATPRPVTPASSPADAVNATSPAGVNAKAGCLNCHDPHISNAKFLLMTDTVEALCARCHDLPLKKNAHQPFAAGQCTVCHQPHQSDFNKLLRGGDGPEHCFGCHSEKRNAFAQSSHIHKVSQLSCTNGGGCHGPHATDYPKLLSKPVNDTCLDCHSALRRQLASSQHVHGAVTRNGCTACHDPHASQQPAELKARTDKVCLTCHEKSLATGDGRTLAAMGPILASSNLHGPVKTGDCSACHLPHAASGPNLLKLNVPDTFYAPFDLKDYALCFSCHDQKLVLAAQTTVLTNFRDGDKNLHFIHVNRADKGRTCKTCHETHGSDLPKHLASSVPFEGSTWSMPINFVQTSDGGSCTPGCHAQRLYTRNKSASIPNADRGAP
jgi:predicted CXXCH cytochrome family protein